MIDYKTLIQQLEKYRDLDLTTLFGDLTFNNMVEKVIELKHFLIELYFYKSVCVCVCRYEYNPSYHF